MVILLLKACTLCGVTCSSICWYCRPSHTNLIRQLPIFCKRCVPLTSSSWSKQRLWEPAASLVTYQHAAGIPGLHCSYFNCTLLPSSSACITYPHAAGIPGLHCSLHQSQNSLLYDCISLAPASYRQHSLAASGRQLLTPLAVLGCHTCGAADFICKSVVSMLALRWLEKYSMLSREPGNLGWVRKHCLAFTGWSQLQCLYAIFAHKY